MGPIEVAGGPGGIMAHLADLRIAARQVAQLADEVGQLAVQLHSVLLNPAVLVCGGFDPIGAAEVSSAVFRAADGPGGASALALRGATLAVALRMAAARYEAVDQLTLLAGPLPGLIREFPEAVAESTGIAAASGAGAAIEHLVTRDPHLADVAVCTLAALLTARSTPAAAVLLARDFPDGHAAVADLGDDRASEALRPPRSLRDLLSRVDQLASGQPGEIDVRMLTRPAQPGGPRQVVVDLPGTRSWSLASHNADVTSIATNLRSLAGERTAYEEGVGIAMHRAGIRPDDDVVLVGHSEGGMVAVNAATRFATTREFHVSRVIAAGAPISALVDRVPESVNVLALENAGDVVPHLDGQPNPDRANVTTATVHRDYGDIAHNHDLTDSYLPGADDVAASSDPSVAAYLDGLAPFLSATAARTRRFLITRVYR
jgi:pimeloyl-ACP methyl ester carboxylesterase